MVRITRNADSISLSSVLLQNCAWSYSGSVLHLLMQLQRMVHPARCSALVCAVLAFLSGPSAVAQTRGTVHFKKFQLFFELLDQSGGLSAEFTASDGDLCSVNGITCQNGEVTAMCDRLDLSAHASSLMFFIFIHARVLDIGSIPPPTPRACVVLVIWLAWNPHLVQRDHSEHICASSYILEVQRAMIVAVVVWFELEKASVFGAYEPDRTFLESVHIT